MENNDNIKKISIAESKYIDYIQIQYIISNCHIEIKHPLPDILFPLWLIKDKFENSFKNKKQIWENYKYIHEKEVNVTKDYLILEQLYSHFNSIYEDAKKVYERRNE